MNTTTIGNTQYSLDINFDAAGQFSLKTQLGWVDALQVSVLLPLSDTREELSNNCKKILDGISCVPYQNLAGMEEEADAAQMLLDTVVQAFLTSEENSAIVTTVTINHDNGANMFTLSLVETTTVSDILDEECAESTYTGHAPNMETIG